MSWEDEIANRYRNIIGAPADGSWLYGPSNDPDGEMAEQYRRAHGEWPKGSRQRYEQDREDEYDRGRPIDPARHPGVRSEAFGGFQTLNLYPEKLGSRFTIGAYVRDSLRFDVEEVRGELTARMFAYVLRESLPKEEQLTETTTVRATGEHVMPATWWQHWKLAHATRWWAAWFVRWRPPRLVTRKQFFQWLVTAEFDLEKRRWYPRADVRVTAKLGTPVTIAIPSPLSFTWADPTTEAV